MEHIYGLEAAQLEQPSVVTIGVFDGVHKGHQLLIRQLVEEAHASGKSAVALTFFPHPDIVLGNLTGRYYLTTPDQRAEELGKLGVDTVVTHPFDAVLRQMRAADFVNLMLKHLKLSTLWIGADFAMGYKREGNVEFLRQDGAQKGFSVHVLELVESGEDHAAISSTAIRQAINQGEVDKAREWLGRGYTLVGPVVHGEKRGRKIGFPTANVDVWGEQVIPANGVYASWATLGSERFMAMTNVGTRPTFNGHNVTVEAYLLDFDRDIYGQKLAVSFETRLRPEARFEGIEALVAQIKADVEAGREYLMQHA